MQVKDFIGQYWKSFRNHEKMATPCKSTQAVNFQIGAVRLLAVVDHMEMGCWME